MAPNLSAKTVTLRALMACSVMSALMLVPPQVSAVGDVWQQRTPLPSAESLYSVVHTGSQWVAVGQQGLVLTSLDGSAWSSSFSGTTAALRGIAWNGSKLIAVGDGGSFISSPDGLAWSSIASPLTLRWNAVTWTGSTFVAAGDHGTIATSPDGSTWTLRTTGSITEWMGIASDGTTTVIVGSQGNIATSTDGMAFASPSSSTTQWLRSVAHNGTRWVAVGDDGTVVTSTNASSWSTTTSGVTVRLKHVHWDGSRFIALGDDGVAITSTDGLSWTTRATGSTRSFSRAASAGGLLVAVADRGSIITTVDVAGTWVERSTGEREWIHDTVWTGSQFVAIGASGRVQTSPDGATWTTRSSGTSTSLNAITWTGTRLVAVGSGGVIISSTDGTAWAAQASGTTRPLLGVAWTGSQVIAVGLRGTFTTSTDGLTWSASTTGTVTLRAIAASGSQIIAVGDSGTVRTFNGSAWTARTSGVTEDLACVATNGSLAIAGGASGNLISSTNLSTWTPGSAPNSATHSSGLHGLRWSGTEFLAVGHSGDFHHPHGYLLDSADGVSWTLRQTKASAPLLGVSTNGSTTVVVGASGLTLTNDGAPLPVVDIAPASASISEEGGMQTLTVSLSSVATSNVIVPAQITGTAVAGTDFTVSTVPVSIIAGQSAASITITAISNAVDTPDKTVTVTLGTPVGATLGAATSATITILDDETGPIFGVPPPGEMVLAGTTVSLSPTVTGGAPMTFQWLRNEVAISKATAQTYNLPSVSVSHGGAYRLQAKNPTAAVKSAITELGVVDGTSKSLGYTAGATATLTVSTGGNGLSWQWQRNDINLANDSRISGVQTGKLVIKNLGGQDTGVYRCLVANGSGSVLGGSNTVTVTSKPFIAPTTFDILMVSQLVSIPVFAGNQPTRYNITNLPSGLTYSSTSGFISGRPLVASGSQPFQVKLSASNAAGSSAVVTVPLTVLPLTAGTSGGFLGTINRVNGLNATSKLGGRMTITVATNGKVTGSAMIGASTHSFTTTLETSPLLNATATATISRSSLPPLVLELNCDPAQQRITGTVSDGIVSTTYLAQRAMASPFTNYMGYYTAALRLGTPSEVGIESIPQGCGYTFFTISNTGTATGTVRLADGTQFALSASLRSNGSLVLYTPLYRNTGSLLGTLAITPGSPALVSTSGLDWFKDTQVTFTRSYADTFGPVALSATGARYTSPADIVMNLATTADDVPNSSLEFSEGGAPSPATRLNVKLRYSKTAIRDLQTPSSNPGNVRISITPSTGLLSGAFSLTDTDTTTGQPLDREPKWYGIIARDLDGVLRGFGHFQLAKMPSNAVFPPTTEDTSPLLSGKVSLLPFP